MAGDSTNANIWADADVYVAFDLEETLPADIDTEFGAGWDLVGLLDGEEGFTETREEDSEDIFAWGGILVRSPKRNFKLTRKFTALEENDVTFRLRWPGSTEGELVVPNGTRIEDVLVAFETQDGTEKRRLITAGRAQITVDGDVNENETDVSKVPFVATIFPDGDGVLFVRQSTEVLSA